MSWHNFINVTSYFSGYVVLIINNRGIWYITYIGMTHMTFTILLPYDRITGITRGRIQIIALFMHAKAWFRNFRV